MKKKPLPVESEVLLAAEITKRAHWYWEAEGCPHGSDIRHWLRAEAEVRAEHGIPLPDGQEDKV